MKLLRRRFLHLTAGAVAIATLTPSIVRAQAQVLKPRSARDRLEEALARIADPKGEGSRACLTVYTQVARDAADAADARARAGVTLGPLDGVIVSIKDLFDVAGEPTRAGSKVLADAPPASADAPVLRRLRAAGGVIVAKTNMSEFAFNITGLNPHYGTPGNPADRTRIPGGSSSGGAVAVADGMCEIAIGTDSGGSVRAPAALCSIVGFKPSQRRIPIDGAFPLSYTLDSIGPMARTVDDCAAADAVIAGEEFRPIEPVTLAGLRLGISRDRLLEGLDEVVSARFSAATTALSKADVRLADKLLPLLDDMVSANRGGGILPVEAYAIHRDRLASKGQDYDPYVRSRLEQVRDVSASDYMNLNS